MAWSDLETFIQGFKQGRMNALSTGTRTTWSTSAYSSLADMITKIGIPEKEQQAWYNNRKANPNGYKTDGLKLKARIDLMLATRRDIRAIYGAYDPIRPRMELDFSRLEYGSQSVTQGRLNDKLKGLKV